MLYEATFRYALRASAFLLLLLGLRFLLRRNTAAALRHAILAWGMAGILSLPLLSALSVHLPLPRLELFDAGFDGPLNIDVGVRAAWDRLVPDRPQRVIASAPVPVALPPVSPLAPKPEILLLVWALGSCLLVLRLGLGLWGVRRLVQRALPIPFALRQPLLAKFASDLQNIDVRLSAELAGPAVTGWLKPVLLLPKAALSWDNARLDAVLLHELAHIRRRDTATQFLAQLVCAVHWFNPLAWRVLAWLRREQECAADDAVLRAGTQPSAYAEHLLAIATLASNGAATPQALLSMARPSELAQRIELLLAARVERRTPSARSLCVAALAVFGPLLLLAYANTGQAHAAPSLTLPLFKPARVSSATFPPVVRRQGASHAQIAQGLGLDPKQLELSFDAKVQALLETETDRLVQESAASRATMIVLEPQTGQILALTSRSATPDVDVAMDANYLPGSTLKPFLVATALEQAVISENSRFFCENGRYRGPGFEINDAHPAAELGLAEVLALSSNIGAAKIFERLGSSATLAGFDKFHLRHMPMPQSTHGRVQDSASNPQSAVYVALGVGISTSPLHVTAAFAALANQGVYNTPSVLRRRLDAGGNTVWQHQPSQERVLSSHTASTVMTLLERVVENDAGTGRKARVPGVRVAGKTGTADVLPSAGQQAQLYVSFVGALPAAEPRYVIFVGAETQARGASGSTVAAPAFARVSRRLLAEN